jgi:DNA-binding NtrC family response regulator
MPQNSFELLNGLGSEKLVNGLAEARLEALRSQVIGLLRELDDLKRLLGPKSSRLSVEKTDLDKEMAAIEVAIIKQALLKNSGNQAAAARMLSMKPSTLHAKVKKYGIASSDPKFVD